MTTEQPIKCYRAIWTEIDGVAVLQIPGSKYAAQPITGRRNARTFVAFQVDDREELCQLKSAEVSGWLVAVARGEDVEPNEVFQ